MAAAPLYFTVSGQDGRHRRTATRLNVSSALVLGDRWEMEGLQDITIINPDGERFDRATIRAKLPLVRKLNAPANL